MGKNSNPVLLSGAGISPHTFISKSKKAGFRRGISENCCNDTGVANNCHSSPHVGKSLKAMEVFVFVYEQITMKNIFIYEQLNLSLLNRSWPNVYVSPNQR